MDNVITEHTTFGPVSGILSIQLRLLVMIVSCPPVETKDFTIQ